jgi:transcriptional regulator GlxA family with amidase domain
MNRRDLVKLLVLSSALLPGMVRAKDSDVKRRQDNPERAVPDEHLTAPLAVPVSGNINVAFLISQEAEVVDFAGPWGVFEYVETGEDGRNPFQLYTVAASKQPVKVSGGMTIVPDHAFADAPAPDVVVIPAMDTGKLAPAALDWLRAVQRDTALTMSVCNGSFVLGEAGLLDDKHATAHHGGYGMLYALYPKATVIRGKRYVEDGKIATAGGLTSGIDLALRVVERYFGRQVAEQTATALEYQGQGWKHPNSNVVFAKKPVSTDTHPLCPICEMEVDKKTSPHEVYHGRMYYFCMEEHKQRFDKTPERFVDQ